MDISYQPSPHKEAIALIEDRPVVSSQVFHALLPELRARAFAVSGLHDANILQAVRDEVASVPAGVTWEKARANIRDALEPFLGEEGAKIRAELVLRVQRRAAAPDPTDPGRAALPRSPKIAALSSMPSTPSVPVHARPCPSDFEDLIHRAAPRLATQFTASRAPILAILQASNSAADFEAKLTAHLAPASPAKIAALVEDTLQQAAALAAAERLKAKG